MLSEEAGFSGGGFAALDLPSRLSHLNPVERGLASEEAGIGWGELQGWSRAVFERLCALRREAPVFTLVPVVRGCSGSCRFP